LEFGTTAIFGEIDIKLSPLPVIVRHFDYSADVVYMRLALQPQFGFCREKYVFFGRRWITATVTLKTTTQINL